MAGDTKVQAKPVTIVRNVLFEMIPVVRRSCCSMWRVTPQLTMAKSTAQRTCDAT
jgi:hypothetical protein